MNSELEEMHHMFGLAGGNAPEARPLNEDRFPKRKEKFYIRLSSKRSTTPEIEVEG